MPNQAHDDKPLQDNDLAENESSKTSAGLTSAPWSLRGLATRRRFQALLVALTAVSASIAGVTNQYAQDDIPLIREDVRVQSLGNPLQILTGAYWPAPHGEFLYRPLATASFAVQNTVGGGSPLVFRLVSYALYATAAVAAWILARMLLPTGIALGVGLLFAAHPVHVEAVALGVNQSEIWVGLLAALMTGLYLRARWLGWPNRQTWTGLSAMYLVGCLFKENALVIPGILIAADALLVPNGGLAVRVTSLWRGYAAMIGLGLGFLVVRTLVVGDAVGTFAAEAVAGQGIGGRILTMLQVVPEWLRLLAWPAHLRGDYSPAVIDQALAWGWPQTLGIGILAGVALVGWLLRRSRPVVTFGLLWTAAAIFPVSNILVPTGIAIAERTLFLPSLGFLLMVGGVVAMLLEPRAGQRRLRLGLVTLTMALVGAGVTRSNLRHRDWRNQYWYWAKTVEVDAPLSYRAHLAFAQLLFTSGFEPLSIQHYYTAMALYPLGWWVRNDLADKLRLRGNCPPALELYEQSLEIESDQSGARASRIACFLYLGRYEAAREEAHAALRRGKDLADFHGFLAVVDSAVRVKAPPGTVHLTIRDRHALW